MDQVNKTLYIPLYGKACVSRRGVILHDPRAEEIWTLEGFELKGKSRSKWLSYYMGMRAAVFDRWAERQMDAQPGAAVIHIGCGLDSRAERIGNRGNIWFDVDFPDVIGERKRYYQESGNYKMIGADVRSAQWLSGLPKGETIVVMEGVSMYLQREELKELLARLREHFTKVSLLMDCYTELAARASRFRNPINDVGVTQVYGLDDPNALEDMGMRFLGERDMTPAELVDELHGMEKMVFRALYADSIAKKMYRLYEYRGG